MKARAAVTPIALLVLAAGAGAYAFLVDRGTVSDADRAARRRDVFPSFRVDEVSRIELDHGSEALVLERGSDAGASWTIRPSLMTRMRVARAKTSSRSAITFKPA